MGFLSQGLKRSDQIVLNFLNIYKTKVMSHGGDCVSFEDLQHFQVMFFPSPKRWRSFKP